MIHKTIQQKSKNFSVKETTENLNDTYPPHETYPLSDVIIFHINQKSLNWNFKRLHFLALILNGRFIQVVLGKEEQV